MELLGFLSVALSHFKVVMAKLISFPLKELGRKLRYYRSINITF